MVHVQANATKQVKLSTSDILGLPWEVQIHHRPSVQKISFSLSVKKVLFLLRFLWKLPFPQNFKCNLGLKSDSKRSALNKNTDTVSQ